jgi:hypothetical protein
MKRILLFIISIIINVNFIKAQDDFNIYMKEIYVKVGTFMKTVETSYPNAETVFVSCDILRTTKSQYRELEKNCKYLIVVIPTSKIAKLGITVFSDDAGDFEKVSYGENEGSSDICILELNTYNRKDFVFKVDALKFKEGFEVGHYGLVIIRVNNIKFNKIGLKEGD